MIQINRATLMLDSDVIALRRGIDREHVPAMVSSSMATVVDVDFDLSWFEHSIRYLRSNDIRVWFGARENKKYPERGYRFPYEFSPETFSLFFGLSEVDLVRIVVERLLVEGVSHSRRSICDTYTRTFLILDKDSIHNPRYSHGGDGVKIRYSPQLKDLIQELEESMSFPKVGLFDLIC